MENNPIQQVQAPSTKNDKLAISGFIIGIIGIVPCLFPLCGLPTSVIGLVLSIIGLKSSKRGLAITGIVLNGLWLLLTIVNAAIGAYLGATGQHELVNKLFGQ